MSGRERVMGITNLAVAAAVTAARPSLADAGADVSAWRMGHGFGRVLIELDGSEAATLADPTGGTLGVEVWANFGTGTEWRLVAILNAGSDIPIVGAGQGWAVVLDLGVDATRLHVAGTASAGTVTATYTPIEVHR